MEISKCPICKKSPTQPINLKCSHNPCFSCAESILAIQCTSDLETKYRIICPVCKKKTLTYDLRHLIISFTEQQEDLFVTSKYLDKKPQTKIQIPNSTDYYSSNNSKRNSIQTIAAKDQIMVKCREHPSNYIKYFCYDCYQSQAIPTLLCSECCKCHVLNNTTKHKVLTLKQSAQKIMAINPHYQNSIPSRQNQLTSIIKNLEYSFKTLFHDYEKIQNDLNEEFQKIYKNIDQKHQELKNTIKKRYNQHAQILNQSLSKAKSLISNFNQLQLNSQQIQHQITFYSTFQHIEIMIENFKHLKIPSTPYLSKNLKELHNCIDQCFIFQDNLDKRQRKNSNLDSMKLVKENLKPHAPSPSNLDNLHKLIA